MTRFVLDCEVKQIRQASGRSSPACYTVTSRRNGHFLGTITRYRGKGSPWQAYNADGEFRGTYYGDDVARVLNVVGGGEKAAVSAIAGRKDA